MNFFKKYRVLIIFILVFSVFFLGFSGFYQSYPDKEISIFSVLYSILRMFLMGESSPLLVNWKLTTARYLAALLVGYGIFVSIYNYLYSWWLGIKIKFFYRSHNVIFGLGRMGYRIAMDLCQAGEKVVVIEQNTENENITKIKKEGAVVIEGNGADEEILLRAGIEYARHSLLLTGSDESNLQIANLLTYLKQQGVIKNNFKVQIHIDDWHSNNFLKDYLDLYNKTPNFDLEPFNIYLSAAQIIYDDYNPLKNTDFEEIIDKNGKISIKSSPTSIAIIGYNKTTEYFITENIILSHSPGLKNINIFLIDQNIHKKTADFKQRVPEFNEFVNLIPIELSSENFVGGEFSDKAFVEKLKTLNAVYFFDEKDAYLLNLANSFRQYLYAAIGDLNRIPLVVCLPERSNILNLLNPNMLLGLDENIPLFTTLSNNFNIHVVKLITDTCTKAKLIDKQEVHNALAKVINYYYSIKYEFEWLLTNQDAEKFRQAKAGEKLEKIFLNIHFNAENPLQELENAIISALHKILNKNCDELKETFGITARWEELIDILQDSNRYVARHLQVKVDFLEKINCPDFLPDTIYKYFKILAPIEHKRWVAEKKVLKYRFGKFPENNKKMKKLLKNTLKIHDQIIPYHELSKEMEDKDFNMFLMIPVLQEIYAIYNKKSL